MEVFSFSFMKDDNFIITIPIAFGPTVSLFKIALYPFSEQNVNFLISNSDTFSGD